MTATPAQLPFVQAPDHAIFAIDAGFHGPAVDACYLVMENGRVAFIDAGINASNARKRSSRASR